MGLNMYLTKTKKVEGFKVEDYFKVDNVISDSNEIDLEKETGLQNANELLNQIKLRGKHFQWYSIFSEVGYWRKANQIHKWFVDNVQNGIDECDAYIVTKEKLEELLHNTNEVLNDNSLCEKLIPSQGGFFFGSTNYDEYYFEDLKLTKEILEKVLKETDFETEVIFYRSSW